MYAQMVHVTRICVPTDLAELAASSIAPLHSSFSGVSASRHPQLSTTIGDTTAHSSGPIGPCGSISYLSWTRWLVPGLRAHYDGLVSASLVVVDSRLFVVCLLGTSSKDHKDCDHTTQHYYSQNDDNHNQNQIASRICGSHRWE